MLTCAKENAAEKPWVWVLQAAVCKGIAYRHRAAGANPCRAYRAVIIGERGTAVLAVQFGWNRGAYRFIPHGFCVWDEAFFIFCDRTEGGNAR